MACTALQGLRDVGHLEAGDHLLIKGASGGVGSAAIQIGKAFGAHVTAIASGNGRDYCLSLGADEFVNYEETDPTSLETRFDVFLDCVGGSPIFGYGRLLGRKGRWVQVAPNVPIYALAPLSPILSPILGLPRIGFVAVRPRARDLEEIRRLVEKDQLHFPVTKVFPLEDIQEAHKEVGRKHGRGKIVVAISKEAGSGAADTE